MTTHFLDNTTTPPGFFKRLFCCFVPQMYPPEFSQNVGIKMKCI